jgi:arabinogalactan endo-1,4-beta-galactosidase
MLRVSYADNDGGQRWSLCGRLAGPWVEELRACWSEARRRAPLARNIVDLTDVTFIDEAGERLLAEMENAGTGFVAGGVENRDLLATLQQNGKRALRRRVEHLGAPCGESAKFKGGDK